MLTGAKLQHVIAKDGNEAFDLYKKHAKEIALVLMDIHMPKCDGYDVNSFIFFFL